MVYRSLPEFVGGSRVFVVVGRVVALGTKCTCKMPDCDSSAAREISRHLQGVSRGAFQLDYGSSLLERSRTRFAPPLEASAGVLTCLSSVRRCVGLCASGRGDLFAALVSRSDVTRLCFGFRLFFVSRIKS